MAHYNVFRLYPYSYKDGGSVWPVGSKMCFSSLMIYGSMLNRTWHHVYPRAYPAATALGKGRRCDPKCLWIQSGGASHALNKRIHYELVPEEWLLRHRDRLSETQRRSREVVLLKSADDVLEHG